MDTTPHNAESLATRDSKIETSWHLSLMQSNILVIQLLADEMLRRDQLCRREIEVLIGQVKSNINSLNSHFERILNASNR